MKITSEWNVTDGGWIFTYLRDYSGIEDPEYFDWRGINWNSFESLITVHGKNGVRYPLPSSWTLT